MIDFYTIVSKNKAFIDKQNTFKKIIIMWKDMLNQPQKLNLIIKGVAKLKIIKYDVLYKF